MMSSPFLSGLGFLLLGLVMGVLFYRELLKWIQRNRLHTGACYICSTGGFVHPCSRCRKQIAMCHDYYLRLTGNPDLYALADRPKTWHLCTECATPEEKEFFEKRGKVYAVEVLPNRTV
jgi:hypothetical protein